MRKVLNHRRCQIGARRSSQRGAALIVALILLVVVAFVGLAAVSTSSLQAKATSNEYDRQIAFQSAEAAMRVAAALIPTHPGFVARNCQLGGTVCQANPFADPNLPSGSIKSVDTGSASGTVFTASAVAPMQPQYVIESLGNWDSASGSAGFGSTANSHNYGVQGMTSTAAYYRITARSCDPVDPSCSRRAIVTLQSVIKMD